jgi:hypothetical protein
MRHVSLLLVVGLCVLTVGREMGGGLKEHTQPQTYEKRRIITYCMFLGERGGLVG